MGLTGCAMRKIPRLLFRANSGGGPEEWRRWRRRLESPRGHNAMARRLSRKRESHDCLLRCKPWDGTSLRHPTVIHSSVFCCLSPPSCSISRRVNYFRRRLPEIFIIHKLSTCQHPLPGTLPIFPSCSSIWTPATRRCHHTPTFLCPGSLQRLQPLP